MLPRCPILAFALLANEKKKMVKAGGGRLEEGCCGEQLNGETSNVGEERSKNSAPSKRAVQCL